MDSSVVSVDKCLPSLVIGWLNAQDKCHHYCKSKNAEKTCSFGIRKKKSLVIKIVKRLHIKVSTRYLSVVNESDVKHTKSLVIKNIYGERHQGEAA